MLVEIEINDYKGINSKPLQISKLDRINYLVGENGSGKSSILEILKIIEHDFDHVQNTERMWVNEHQANALADFRRVFNENFYVKMVIDNAKDPIQIYNYPNELLISVENDSISSNSLKFIYKPLGATNSISKRILTTYFSNGIDLPLTTNFSFDIESFDENIQDSFIKFINEHLPEFKSDQVIRVYKSISQDASTQIETNNMEVMNVRALAAGYRSLLRMYFSIDKAIKAAEAQSLHIICIEEPETTLHPEFQKLIPKILNGLLDANSDKIIQFIVATHSPFIISSSNLYEKHKTYLIKDGNTVDLAQTAGQGAQGYSKDKAKTISAKLLGAGIDDLTKGSKTRENLHLLYCEGDVNDDQDSIYYKILFPSDIHGLKTVFISCGGFSEVENAFYIGKETARLSLGENVKVSCIVDRNCSKEVQINPTLRLLTNNETSVFNDEHRRLWMDYVSTDGHARMLNRREIENYLYDPEIVKKVHPDVYTQDLYQGVDIQKDDVKELFKGKFDKKRLAKRLYKERKGSLLKIYTELKHSIFNI